MGTFKRSIAWLLAERRARRSERELMALDDRLLADIGLSRAQIWYAVHEGGSVSAGGGSSARLLRRSDALLPAAH